MSQIFKPVSSGPVPPTVVETLTSNDGVHVPPTGNNINVFGQYTVTTVGNVGTSTLTVTPSIRGYPITPFVVGPATFAGYQTIQSAVTAANAAGGGSVYVMPGTYTENLTLFGNVDIVGNPGNSDSQTAGNTVIIVGTHTPPTTGSFTIVNVTLQSATDVFLSVAAGSASIVIENAFIKITNGYLFNLLNWTGFLITYNIGEGSTNNGMVNNTGGATCFFISATHGAGTANTMITSGPVILEEVVLNCPWAANTGTTIACDYVIFNQNVTTNNNSFGHFRYCEFITGVNPAITMSSTGAVELSHSIINSSNVPAISGSGVGTITYADLIFLGDTTFSGSLTLAPANWQPYCTAGNINTAVRGTSGFNAAQFTVTNGYVSLATPAAFGYVTVNHATSPYTVTLTDQFISCDPTAGTITINLPNAPLTFREIIIKDRTGQASVNNISVTTLGGAVTIDGQTTYTLAGNFGSIQLLFNGTSYEVF